jgi:hypothetical protein
MTNVNVYEFTGNIESAIKNGDFRYIILFEGITSPINKIVNSFQNIKKVEENNFFNRKLIETRSPFRIGRIHINLLETNNIFIKEGVNTSINFEFLRDLITYICKTYKNNIIAFPIFGAMNQYKNEIINLLKETVRGTKVQVIQ